MRPQVFFGHYHHRQAQTVQINAAAWSMRNAYDLRR